VCTPGTTTARSGGFVRLLRLGGGLDEAADELAVSLGEQGEADAVGLRILRLDPLRTTSPSA
jgi:hypothetical protein